MLDMPDRPGLGLLRTHNRERVLEIRFSFRRIRLCRQQRDLTRDAIDLGFVPLFLGRSDRRQRFVNATPSIIELAEFRVGSRQFR
jgi:hypothetical protein